MTMKSALFWLGITLFPMVAAMAEARFSQDYAIGTEVVDAAGGFGTSADYGIAQAVGETAVGRSDPTPASYLGRHGIIGQLADFTELLIALTPNPIDEASTGQLSATARRDDLTTDPLSPAAVTWSLVSGPVASISAGGSVTTLALYANKPAVIEGSWQGIAGQVSFTIQNVLPDNYGSYAGDGIDDGWQVGYFGQNNPLAGPLADPDADGNTNLLEWLAGLVPTDPGSVFLFQMDQPTVIPGRATILFGPIVPGRSYQVLWSENLTDWHKLDPQQAMTQDLPPNRMVSDNGAPAGRRFYRIVISLP